MNSTSELSTSFCTAADTSIVKSSVIPAVTYPESTKFLKSYSHERPYQSGMRNAPGTISEADDTLFLPVVRDAPK